MTPPNALTLSRLGSAFLLMILLVVSFPFSKTLALVVFAVGGLTDYLDGHLARKVYGITAFGTLMDPVTDKVMVCAAFVSFVELQLVSAIVVVAIITREFLVTGLRLLAIDKGHDVSAGRWGKHKTVWQIVGIVIILLGLAIRQDFVAGMDPGILVRYDALFLIVSQVVSILVALVTVASGALYLHQHRDLILGNL